MKFVLALALLLAFATGAPAALAAEEAMSAVITHVDASNNSITVREADSGTIRTYFLRNNTRITSNGQALPLSQVKRGQQVELRFQRTDVGREVLAFRVAEPMVLVDLIPITVQDEKVISGEIVGLRRNSLVAVVREDASGQRRAVQMSADTRISRDGRTLNFRQLAVGDFVALRYIVTEQGLMVVTARAPEVQPAPVADQAELPKMLPKTAGNSYNWLVLGLTLALGGLALQQVRRHNRA